MELVATEQAEAQIKEGYKKTEVGVIPSDWNIKSFSEVFEFLSTASFSRSELSGDEEIKYIHYGDIHTQYNHFINFQAESLPSISYEKGKKYALLKEGDLIMADASEDYDGIGKSVEVKNIGSKLAISGLHTFLLRDRTGEFINGFRGYIHLIRFVKESFERLATGLKVYGISKKNLKTILIPIPTLAEQKAIATALSDIDSFISSLNKLIAKKKAIKQGAMQQLLKSSREGGKRLAGFEGEWEALNLGDVSWVNQGLQIAIEHRLKSSTASSKKYLTIQYLNEGKQAEYIENYSDSVTCKNEDILMTRTGNTGIVITNVEGVFHNNFFKINYDKKRVGRDYLFYFLSFSETYKEILERAGTSTIPDLNHKDFYSIPIIIPPIPEQQAIATILSDMDTEIEALEKKKSKYQRIKQGMMQELLTGKTRLV